MDDGTEEEGSYIPYLGVVGYVYNTYWCHIIWNMDNIHSIPEIGEIYDYFTNGCRARCGRIERLIYNQCDPIKNINI